MYFRQIHEKKLSQYAYLIGCPATGDAIIIDPMRDIDQYYKLAEEEGLEITAAADTHIHADYVSGLREFAERDVKVFASDEGGEDWRYEWLIGSEYDYELITEGDSFCIGNIEFDVLHTPGHTPESVSFLVTDSPATDQPMGILTGDFVFVGDIGRPDLLETAAGQEGAMKPAAKELYKSVKDFKNLPEYLQVWPGHGSGSACGKALGAVPESTVGYELRFSPAFQAATSENKFVDFILDGQPEPPRYFSRMKKVNREGPAVLGRDLFKPERLSVDELLNREGVIIDTRDKYSFANGHLSGSLLSTLEDEFNTIAGSYVDADSSIYLIIEEANVLEAVRDLIRVGLDNIKGYATPQDLRQWNGELTEITLADFEDVEKSRQDKNVQLLDVRKATEFNEGHIPGAVNIAHTRLAVHLDELAKSKTLMVHCASGRRASYASSLLARNGFSVQWVDDDFEQWQRNYSPHSSKAVSS